MDDDIVIPAPRVAKDWYCAECGGRGGLPDPGYHQMDRRYAVGMHHCKHAIRGKTPRVALVADFAWDPEAFMEQQRLNAMKIAYDKQERGSIMKPDEVKLAERWRTRIGLIANKDAK